jgi:hypothetical protein
MSDEESQVIAIDEESDHQIVHRRRFGKTNRATHQALDLWDDVPLIRSPSM